MRLRANIVLVVAVLFALAQMLASATGSSPLSRPATVLTAIAHHLPSTAIAGTPRPLTRAHSHRAGGQ